MFRRDYGSGSVVETAPNTFRIRIAAGIDPVSGRRRTVTETFRGNKKAAQRRAQELSLKHAGRSTTGSALKTLIDLFLETHRVAAPTMKNYRLAAGRIPERFGTIAVDRLRAQDLDRLYAALAVEHSAHAIRQVHAVISAALTQAVKWDWVPGNVARYATPPTVNKSRSQAPDADILARLLKACGTDQQKRLWLRLVAVTGARRSEVLALRWANVDLAKGKLTFAGSLDTDRNEIPTKTGRGRTVTIDPQTVEQLRLWRVAQKERALAVGVKLAKNAFVLSDELDSSRPWRPDRATERFRSLCKQAGVTGVRLHDLRHHAATTLLRAGVPINAVSARLGHSRVATTLDVYGHVMAGDDATAADVLGRAIG